jgi:hypothetical protein
MVVPVSTGASFCFKKYWMKVLILPNPDKKPFHRYERVLERSADGQYEQAIPEKELTRAPNTKFDIMAPISRKTGNVNTGALLEEIENPYSDLPSYATPDWERYLKGKDNVLRQYVLEYKHGRNPGFYTNQIPRSSQITKDDPSKIPFFQTGEAMWQINDGVTVLDLDKPKDEILYYLIPALPQIANSFSERTNTSIYYLAGEAEEQERKASKSRRFDSAIAKLVEVEELQDDTIKKFMKILVPKYHNADRSQAYTELSTFIRKSDTNLREFNNVFKLWKDHGTRDKFNVRALLTDYKQARVIVRSNNEYSWLPPRDSETGVQPDKVTWSRESEIIDFLLDPKFEPEQSEMQKQYEFKMRFK